ncbi:hypothetical protein QYM36_008687 [Artemia franciscana]|uniref:Succinate dehydrogenase cytochrome b560 subunit, mitochondrial n=1 Tax=Artemia franciscana TaxID=6661 RepID=A0AA88HRR3_ARTSF|nr:hypothetical protein QYM36_008594 [Artemia franciscana]KAK2714205.1 hypothetical protein QYM36_008687 [Artemia franciscana]
MSICLYTKTDTTKTASGYDQVHKLADEDNPKCKLGEEPPISKIEHDLHEKYRYIQREDEYWTTSKIKYFLGKIGLLKKRKSLDEPQKRSVSTLREMAEKTEQEPEIDKGPQTAKIAGLELPHHALGPHARAKFNKDLLEAEAMNYIKKQQALHRPMSPHLTIYAPQWTWLLSISHRVTGVMLTTSLYGLGIGYMFASHPFGYYINLLHSLNIPVPLIFLMKFGLGAATSFHVLNGIRHLAWDTGRGFDLKTVYRTAYIVTALSGAGGLYLAML